MPLVATLEHIGSGKVREMYRVDEKTLLIVATDRISAYDAILPDPIPDKGRVLTGLSAHWFDLLDAPHHLISTDTADLAGLDDPAGRSMQVRSADVIPMECVVRGYLYGSSWREYRDGGGPTTEHLPPGLRMADRLDRPIFTPATKAESGHDENLDEAGARLFVGDDVYEALRDRSIDIYRQAAEYAAARGILLADTKFEFGWIDGEITLIDEVLTPDSSRYWPADEWHPGSPAPSYDKQYVRDALDASGWDHSPPAPRLSDEVISGTRARYIEAYERLTGRSFDTYLKESGV
ncbi:phosphoribosylaminoimidazolesuccinocarboxamide synthase [bacterium]|nr:phosphoribosylaminoimidazolesuccinocarboxamide synthase [bacterium]